MDFIIPCHPKDFSTLQLSVSGIKNIKVNSRIFLISKKDPNIEGTIHIPENLFDEFVLKDDVRRKWEQNNKSLSHRSKWIYQQLLKILSYKVIKDLSESYVIVDSDTIFLKDISFDENKFYYCIAQEYHLPYLNPIKKLLNLEKTIGFSCISHHMIFNKEKMNMMIGEIEERFNKKFSDIVLDIIDYNEASCFSEWDLYSNYMITKHQEQTEQRQLKWANIPYIPSTQDLGYLKNQYDFISCHAYDRGLE